MKAFRLARAYTVHFGGEFHGVFPSTGDAHAAYERAVYRCAERQGHRDFELAEQTIGHVVIQLHVVTRRDLENIKEDDVTDIEWECYK